MNRKYRHLSREERYEIKRMQDLGVSLYNLGRLEEAIKAYDNAIELEHDYEEAINNRAIVIQQIGSHNDGKVA